MPASLAKRSISESSAGFSVGASSAATLSCSCVTLLAADHQRSHPWIASGPDQRELSQRLALRNCDLVQRAHPSEAIIVQDLAAHRSPGGHA